MFKKIAIIGAGVMGSGIAAQVANNNVEVLLYDLENEDGLIAEKAINRLLSASPSQLAHKSIANSITPLNLKKDLSKIKECDLVIEAIVENISIKHELYKDIAKFLSKDSILASNTSTIQLSALKTNLPLDIANKLVICHFFNPPRFMRLLELVPGTLEKNIKDNLIDFLTHRLGKNVIICKDTPGFIANRLCCFLMELVLQESIKHKKNIVEIDYIFSKFLGFPSTGIFGLYDLIGLDVMGFITNSLKSTLNPSDAFSKIYQKLPQMEKMVKEGYNGRKGKGGFYKVEIDKNGQKQKYAIDLLSFEYKTIEKMEEEYQTIQDFLNSKTEIAKFIASILNRFFIYLMNVHDKISSNPYDIDAAMQLGCAWKYGPFELMQKYNLVPGDCDNEFKNLSIDITKFGIKPKSLQNFCKNHSIQPIAESKNYRTWHLKTNKICFELKSKMHVLNEDIFNNLSRAVDIAETKNTDLIIYSDFDYFSAGADLKIFYEYIEGNSQEKAENFLKLGQQTMLKLKYSKIPIISCARGVALGGGCEILLHSDHIIAHQDLSAGLVECSVGLIPGWGGLKEMILRSSSKEELTSNLTSILNQYKSSSAIDFTFHFKQQNVISLANTDDLLNFALENTFEKKKHTDKSINIASPLTIDLSSVSKDVSAIGKTIMDRLHKDLSEEDLLKIERDIFLILLASEDTKKKISAFKR